MRHSQVTAHNDNRGITGIGVSCWVCAKALSRKQKSMVRRRGGSEGQAWLGVNGQGLPPWIRGEVVSRQQGHNLLNKEAKEPTLMWDLLP